MGAKKECCLESDDSGHWYVIPYDKKKDWEEWEKSDDSHDGIEPIYAVRIDGPTSIRFPWYKENY